MKMLIQVPQSSSIPSSINLRGTAVKPLPPHTLCIHFPLILYLYILTRASFVSALDISRILPLQPSIATSEAM